MSERITSKNVQNVAVNLLDELQLQGHVPAEAAVVVTKSEPSYGITWGVRVTTATSSRPGHRVETVLDRALDGITSTREAWLVLDATLRTLRWCKMARRASSVPVSIGSSSLQGAADHCYMLAVESGAAPANCSVRVSPVGIRGDEPHYSVVLVGGRGARVDSFFDDIRFGPSEAEAIGQLIVLTHGLRAAAMGRGRR